VLKKQGYRIAVGDEGGFAPTLPNHKAALQVLVEAIQTAGYEPGKQVFLALDAAASEFTMALVISTKANSFPPKTC